MTSAEPEVDAKTLRASALRQAQWLVAFYRISPEELTTERGLAVVQSDPEVAVRPVKYCHPVSGQTWDGMGVHPAWLRQALLKDGYRVEELRVSQNKEDGHARSAA